MCDVNVRFGLNHLEIGLIERQIISWPVGRPSDSQIGFRIIEIDMQYNLIIFFRSNFLSRMSKHFKFK